MMGDDGGIGRLDKNILFEVLSRVDAATLATVACVNKEFRLAAADHVLWENLCHNIWPTTMGSGVKSLMSSVGGYRILYKNCFPCIVSSDQYQLPDGFDVKNASDFLSIVDVLYGDQPMFSKLLDGFPGDQHFRGWLSDCAFRLDLLNPEDQSDIFEENAIVVESGILSAAALNSRADKTDSKSGPMVWNTMKEKMRMSWILINKKTKAMTNLSSWRPVAGNRHWDSDTAYLFRFGSILPGDGHHRSESVNAAVQCNITTICRLSLTDMLEGDTAKTVTTLSLTQLSLQLENLVGEVALGKNSHSILEAAMVCAKSRHTRTVISSYNGYMKSRNDWKNRRAKAEVRLNTIAGIASSIFSLLVIVWVFT